MTDPQKNPLPALEELLKESKGEAPAVDPAVAAAEAAAQASEAAAKEDARIAELGASHQQLDKAALQAEVARLAAIKNTPEYQARIEQDTAKTQTEQQARSDSQGYGINQLGHIKI